MKVRLAEQLSRLIFGYAKKVRELGNPADKYARRLPNQAEYVAGYNKFVVVTQS